MPLGNLAMIFVVVVLSVTAVLYLLRKKKAVETVELFLPMARQIENQRLVDELNDLSVKYL